ncbi:unnamed protein product [Ambrosiozyma monospora]|uniref:Unnamed protein product n=1 Tax=Ambrosiozyma monospora TaxID=43982 RepID=A0A9W6Z0F3_AMBMO|nr:unnamed protein product [Ambrosiozyma monospora]
MSFFSRKSLIKRKSSPDSSSDKKAASNNGLKATSASSAHRQSPTSEAGAKLHPTASNTVLSEAVLTKERQGMTFARFFGLVKYHILILILSVIFAGVAWHFGCLDTFVDF